MILDGISKDYYEMFSDYHQTLTMKKGKKEIKPLNGKHYNGSIFIQDKRNIK
jgi:hypothetical protein